LPKNWPAGGCCVMRRWLPSWFPRRSSQAVPSSSQPRRRNRSSLRPRRRLRPRRLRLHYPAANGANRRGPVRRKNPSLASPTQYLTAIERASRRPSNRRAGPKCSHYVPRRRLRRLLQCAPSALAVAIGLDAPATFRSAPRPYGGAGTGPPASPDHRCIAVGRRAAGRLR
jgi:hypothetical protein